MIIKLVKYFTLAIAIFLLTVACNSDTQLQHTPGTKSRSPNQENVLQIWWDKGYYPEEDEALRAVVSQWEQQTGNQVQLGFYTNDELSQKTQRAIQAGNPPDILMNDGGDRTIGSLAWSGQLADVSEVIEPAKSLLDDTMLSSVSLYNNVAQKQGYYAVPIHVSIPHIFYWRDLLLKIGKNEQDIPQDWNGFWQFWQQAQIALQAKQKETIYGIGLPLCEAAVDTYEIFEQILEAYDVVTVDSNGNLQVDLPEIRQGIVNCLDWYAGFYLQGYVPPEAVRWLNPDNNRSLLNYQVAMTPNNSLSIPAALGRDSDEYKNKLVTAPYPNKPSGEPMKYIALVRQAIILADAPNQKLAKEFLSYLIQPEIIGDYLKAAGGRFFPVNNKSWSDPFWTDPSDPHISTAAQPFLNQQTRLSYTSLNPAYSLVLKEGIWGQALNRIAVDKISPEQAGDEAISQIKEIFAAWK
ncbi:ABC transporter substrate-binding protein [Pleurocapsa sp. PCC 7319]|uniref:ABC transporter substrate-binding protein n=1 Tax=Pleurocapsa sp. PCC 7319 TaxID=118161 RepID=UPI00034ACC26|nr:ABC transporter substrate-binding protein [Pleurocapsa sp. PCC 7319]